MLYAITAISPSLEHKVAISNYNMFSELLGILTVLFGHPNQ